MAEKSRAQILGANLKRLRKDRGISRKEIADMLEVNEQLIGLYERGERLPPLDKIYMIAMYLEVSISELTGDTPYGDESKVLSYRLARAKDFALRAGYLTMFEEDGTFVAVKKRKPRKNPDGTYTLTVDRMIFDNFTDFVEFVETVEVVAMELNRPFKEAFIDFLQRKIDAAQEITSDDN